MNNKEVYNFTDSIKNEKIQETLEIYKNLKQKNYSLSIKKLYINDDYLSENKLLFKKVKQESFIFPKDVHSLNSIPKVQIEFKKLKLKEEFKNLILLKNIDEDYLIIDKEDLLEEIEFEYQKSLSISTNYTEENNFERNETYCNNAINNEEEEIMQIKSLINRKSSGLFFASDLNKNFPH
jgi:hypothetical protein